MPPNFKLFLLTKVQKYWIIKLGVLDIPYNLKYKKNMESIAVLIPLAALTIPIVAIILSHKRKIQSNKIKELELQKEILELEVEKQNSKVKLLEEENKKYDKIIYENMNINNIPKI